jgi:hypothetical protein
LSHTTRFVWHGWSLIAELRTDNSIDRSYDWGLGFSGGIGGLLAINDSGESYLASYDGNGNLSALTAKSSGALCAAYEYDPYGNLIRKTGEYADDQL